MSDPLYKKELLRLAADATGAGRLPRPGATGEAFNPTCGDRVIVDLSLKEGRIVEMAHDTKACVLAQASASILGAALKGASQEDVDATRDAAEPDVEHRDERDRDAAQAVEVVPVETRLSGTHHRAGG